MTGNKEKVSIFILANLPLHSALGKEEPFNLAHEAQAISNDDAIQGIIFMGVLSYQFFSYFEIIEERFGEEIARIAKEHMFITLNRLNAAETDASLAMGDQIKHFMNFIQKIYKTEPFTHEINGETITPPKEYTLAFGMLYGLEQSPYYSSNQRNGEKPKYLDTNLDIKFADFLDKARQGMVDKYAEFFFSDAVILDESSVAGLRNKSEPRQKELEKIDFVIENYWKKNEGNLVKRIFKVTVWAFSMLWFVHLIWLLIFPR